MTPETHNALYHAARLLGACEFVNVFRADGTGPDGLPTGDSMNNFHECLRKARAALNKVAEKEHQKGGEEEHPCKPPSVPYTVVNTPFVWESKITEAIAAMVESQELVIAEHRQIGGMCVKSACEGEEASRHQHLTNAASRAQKVHVTGIFVANLKRLHQTLTGKPLP